MGEGRGFVEKLGRIAKTAGGPKSRPAHHRVVPRACAKPKSGKVEEEKEGEEERGREWRKVPKEEVRGRLRTLATAPSWRAARARPLAPWASRWLSCAFAVAVLAFQFHASARVVTRCGARMVLPGTRGIYYEKRCGRLGRVYCRSV